MANRIQAIGARGRFVAALLLGFVVPAGAEFSHKIHLAKQLECAVCHAVAASSTSVSDNLLPSPQVCTACHTGEAGKGPKLATPPVVKAPSTPAVAKFNHRLHTRMGNIAAVIAKAIDSKTYLSDPGDTRKFLDTKNNCAGCHRGMELSDAVTPAAFPRMADCLVCHNKIEPPFSCTKCHGAETRLRPASHTTDWVDVHSAGKLQEKTSCAVCHGRTFTCMGCH